MSPIFDVRCVNRPNSSTSPGDGQKCAKFGWPLVNDVAAVTKHVSFLIMCHSMCDKNRRVEVIQSVRIISCIFYLYLMVREITE